MPRLLVHVEGQTEAAFVNEVLARYLWERGYERVSARLLGNARQRDRRGGIHGWSTVRRDISRHLAEDPGCIATTMVDYYGLPPSGDKAWPGRAAAAALPVAQKGVHMANALSLDLAAHMDLSFDPRRFVPFVVIHEFEGLLFSDCAAFARTVGRQNLAGRLQEIRDQFSTPEEIDDAPTTAPSRRIAALMPDYTKPLFGTFAASEIGLDSIARQCPHFRTWLAELADRAAVPSR